MTARDYLFGLEIVGIKLGLEQIRALILALDHPDLSYPSVVVAGTNGKGSVTAMLERGLRDAGYRTGRYTSPHLTAIEERMAISQRDPYLSTHPLTPDRIAAFEEAAAHSPYINKPDSPEFLMMHHRIVAKLMGFITPDSALQHFAEADPSVPARYARAIAWYRKGALGSALLGIDRLIKEYPNDPYFNEVRGQMLFENGHAADAVVSYRRAVQLLPGSAVIKIDFARALLETNNTDNDREAVRNLELARQQESDSFDLWRLMASGYSRLNNPGMTSLARAEMAILRGQRAEAQAHADAAVRQLQSGTPAWQRAQDIKAYINTRPGKGR